METFFLEVLNRGISAGWLILVVILLRQFLGKAPKYIRMILWGIVAVRLICPCSIASVFSLIPSEQTIRPEIMQQQVPEIHSGVASIDGVLNPVIKKNFALNTVQNANPLQILIPVVSVIWLVGVGCMLFYMIMSFLRIHKKVAVSITYQDNVMLCDDIDSPFLFGMIKPRIFLPSTLEEGVLDSVIAHEKTHIKRRDHWWKPLGFAILAVYWFHPLVWASYLLFCRDMELACDEAVVKDMDAAGKKAYSNALLACSLPRKMIRVCPLAFGEDGVKMRVKSVLNYRKPTFWMMVTAGMLCIVIALCFLTNPAPKYLLKGIKAQDITSIKVFDGNNGQEFIIEEPKEIVEIVENFQSTPMKREKSSIGYMGYRFRMTFTDKEGKEIEQFILNQKNTIREDPFFYISEQPLCYDYIEQLEQKYLGSASEESAKGNKRKEPPKLQVSYREDVVTASTLTYSWKVFHEDGTVAGGEADSPHPLDIIDKLPKIPIDYGSNQVFFTFKEDPETVTVRAWDISHDADKNTYDSNFIELEYEVYGEHLLAIPMDANYVYEVTGSWDTESCQGEASYGFVTEWREYSKKDWSLKAVDAPDRGSSTTVSAKDLYVDGAGYGWFQCTKSGTYRFRREGTLEDVALETREEIEWDVYLLAQPYNDVPRLLPQAYQAPVLIGDGDIFIKKGQYVVIYCSQNAYTYGLSGEFRGDEKAMYRCEFLKENVSDVSCLLHIMTVNTI